MKGRKCELCGKRFAPANNRQIYCSAACARRVRDRRARARQSAARAASLARVRAYLALPPAERYARRGELTQAEHALAQKMYLENHAIRTVATNDLMH